MKPWIITMQVLGALPLALYPVLLLANLMSLAGQRTPGDDKVWSASRWFLWSSTAYPLAFASCVIAAWKMLGLGHQQKALMWSVVPLLYLALVGVFFWNWSRAEK